MSDADWSIPESVLLANQMLGMVVVPLFSGISLICSLFTMLIIYIFEVDRACLMFVVLFLLANAVSTIFKGFLFVR